MKNHNRGRDPSMAIPNGEWVIGRNAALAVLAVRPHDVLAVFADDHFDGLAHTPVQAQRMQTHALERLVGEVHHEGILVVTKPRKWMPAASLMADLKRHRGVAIAFDRVRNPYNVGAILRTAAFLGARGVLFGPTASPSQAMLAPLALRVAEGGAEHLQIARTTDLAHTLRGAKELGVTVVGSAGGAHDSYESIRGLRPCILVVGNEAEGMSPAVLGICDRVVKIPGTGAVESLNVSVATSLLLSNALSDRALDL